MVDLRQIEEFAKELIKEFCPNYNFVWMRAKTVHGQCSYDRRLIRLSKPYALVATHDQLFNTVTHEIAHAIVGSGHGHDDVWRRKHIELGGNGKRCSDVVIPRPKRKVTWKLSCASACWEIDYTKRPKTAGRICRTCRGKVLAREV